MSTVSRESVFNLYKLCDTLEKISPEGTKEQRPLDVNKDGTLYHIGLIKHKVTSLLDWAGVTNYSKDRTDRVQAATKKMALEFNDDFESLKGNPVSDRTNYRAKGRTFLGIEFIPCIIRKTEVISKIAKINLCNTSFFSAEGQQEVEKTITLAKGLSEKIISQSTAPSFTPTRDPSSH